MSTAVTLLTLTTEFFLSRLPVSEHHLVSLVPIAAVVVVLAAACVLEAYRKSWVVIAALALSYSVLALYWQFALWNGLGPWLRDADGSAVVPGNQKLGCRYAIDNGFDIVALVHGDGQYAPEELPRLLGPLARDEADAVFGSRMIDKRAARQGGMPVYKWIGNQVLTAFQNRVLGTKLSEFHTGYRLYSTAALRQIPFERNTNAFHFDTEIIVQFVLRKLRIAELPIPTFYGDEVCHVNGMKYALDVFKSTVKARLCGIHLFYDRKFDVTPEIGSHSDKLAFPSSQTFAIAASSAGLGSDSGASPITATCVRR